MTLPASLQLEFQPSRWLKSYLAVLFLLAAISLAMLLSGIWMILALIALSAYAGTELLRHGKSTSLGFVTGLDLSTSSNTLYRYGFKDELVSLLPPRRIGQRLLVMRLKQENGAEMWLPVFRDQLSAEQFRRLRVWLNFTPSPAD